jgi:hypothetical protein
MGARIVAALAGQYDDPVLRLLSEAVTSGSSQHVLAVGAALRAAPRNFAWSHTDFVINALQAAEKLGDYYISSIVGGLHAATIQGSRVGTPGQPYQEDLEQRDKATELIETLPPCSI